MKGLKITLIFLFLCASSSGQSTLNSAYKLGLSYSLGATVHRLGVQLGFYMANKHAQIQSIGQVFYCFKNYGPKVSRLEAQFSAGAQVAFGNAFYRIPSTVLLSEISNFSERQYAVGYGLKYYWDQIGTTQTSGLISLRSGNLFMATENDGLVFKAWDRYRTGGFVVGFDINNDYQFAFGAQRVALNLLLYTGSAQDERVVKMKDSSYPARFGYLEMDNARYGKESHGILSVSWQGNLGRTQNAFAEIGIDDERIRNVVQNKFIHDMPLLPKRWLKIENPHIPMKTKEGTSFLYKKEQAIQPSKFVWGVGLNRVLFY